MTKLKLNYGVAIFRICLDSEISGTIVGRRLSRPMPFSDFTELLLKVESVMDEQDYPRAFQKKRQFYAVKPILVPCAKNENEMMSEETVNSSFGSLKTFLLHVVSRLDTGWQGVVSTIDSGERFLFKSELQFIGIIDNLLH